MQPLKSIIIILIFSVIVGSCTKDEPEIELNGSNWIEFDYECEIKSGTEKIDDELNILVIGNSFGVDITQRLPEILRSNKILNINIHRLYKGGATIKDHLDGLLNGKNIYENYYYMQDSRWQGKNTDILKNILLSKHWDIIVLSDTGPQYIKYKEQQVYIKDFVKNIIYTINYKPKFVWQESWAYADGYEIKDFYLFEFNERLMFNTINYITYNKIRPTDIFWRIVPCCTSLQNARNSVIDSSDLHLTRDGYHADLGFTRILLAYTFLANVILPYTDIPLEKIEYIDWAEGNIKCTLFNKNILRDCVINSMTYPYKICFK